MMFQNLPAHFQGLISGIRFAADMSQDNLLRAFRHDLIQDCRTVFIAEMSGI